MNFEKRDDGINVPGFGGITAKQRIEMEDSYIPDIKQKFIKRSNLR